MKHPKCEVVLRDCELEISGECRGISDKLRFYRKTIGISGRTYRKEVSGEFEDLFYVDRDKDGAWLLYTLPGFAHKVLDHCRANGIPFEFRDRRTPLPEPDADAAFEGLRDYQMDAVAEAVNACGGVIKLPTGSGKTRVAAGIIKAFPRAEMVSRGTPTYVFACPDKDINRKNWLSFRELMPDRDVGIVMSGMHKPSDDVVCCTIDSLENLDPEQVGVLVCDEMHTASSRGRMEKIMRFRHAARWGVSATPTGRFDGGDLVAEGLFGPIVFEMTYADMVKKGALVPIKVLWLDCPDPECGLRRYAALTDRDAKVRNGLTGNLGLCRLIADTIAAIPDSMQTLCIVQYLEHMDHIVSSLSEVLDADRIAMVHGETSQENMTEWDYLRAISAKERKSIYDRFASGEIRKAISTHVWKQGVDFVDLQVIINAGGGGSDIVAKQIPGRASRISEDKSEAFVIDFWPAWDTDDPMSRNAKGRPGPLLSAAKQRRRAYGQLGFEQIWLDNTDQLLPRLTAGE